MKTNAPGKEMYGAIFHNDENMITFRPMNLDTDAATSPLRNARICP
jgi:hypothetical protein